MKGKEVLSGVLWRMWLLVLWNWANEEQWNVRNHRCKLAWGTVYTWREAGRKFRGLFSASGPPASHQPESTSVIPDELSADSWNFPRHQVFHAKILSIIDKNQSGRSRYDIAVVCVKIFLKYLLLAPGFPPVDNTLQCICFWQEKWTKMKATHMP